MTTEVPTKLRFVRCPKCRKVLPELPNIPVYQCGGCLTILQAKRRKPNNKDTELLNHDTDGSQKVALERASEDKEARRSNQEELSSPGSLVLNENNKSETERNRKQTGEIEVSRELPQDLAKEEGYREVRLSDGAASSIELDHQRESVESSPVSEDHNAMAENATSSERDDQPNPNGKPPGGSNVSNEVVSSTEVDHEESEGSPRRIGESVDSPKQHKPRDGDISEYRSWKQPEDVNFSHQVASSAEFHRHRSERSSVDTTSLNEEDENQDFVEESKRDDESDSGEISSLADKVDENLKQPEDVDFPDEVIASSAELNHFHSRVSSVDSKNYSEKDVEESYPITGAHTEFDGKLKTSEGNKLLSESFSTDGLMSPHNEHTAQDQNRPRESWSDKNVLSGSSRSSIPRRFSGESFLTDGLMSPRNELLPEDQSRDFDGDDVSEHLALHNSSSEFTDRQRDALKSRTTSINYAYEGSASSSDETDNPVSLRRVHLSKRKLKEAEAGSTKTAPKRDEGVDKIRSAFPATQPHGRNSSAVSPENNHYAAISMKREEGVNKIRSGFPATQPHGRNSSSVSPENNRYAARISQWHQDELETLATNALPVRRRARFQTGEGTSKLPPSSKSHRAGGENGNHSNFVRRHMGSASSKRPEDLEKEKIELLKMVYDLQTELKRTHISNGKTRFPGDHAAPEAGIHRDFSHTRSAFSCNQGRRPYQARDSRIPFSAEATIRRRQDETYCLHCCPQEWQLQALLPPHSCCDKAQSAFHSGRRSHQLHHSGTSSPLYYATSEASDDHLHRDHETRRVHREKAHSAKRHVLPIVGGAPLVACYKCFEVLQLPADFPLFKRRVHQLQCSGCSTILKFSLHKGKHIVPYQVYTADADVEAVAPPPSEVDAFSDVHVRTKFDSDDYGPPNSYSTESEPIIAGRPSQARSNGRTVSSGSSYEPVDEKRKEESLLKSLGKKIYSHAGTFSSTASSSSKTKRVSSEIHEASGSPLHKLMGYASPSKVMER